MPEGASGLVVFAHGSGSSRFSPRNLFVAENLRAKGLATLLFDLLEEHEAHDPANVFDIELLSRRVADAVDWIDARDRHNAPQIGLFGASTGAAAALVAAVRRQGHVAAVVSRGGRPDLAGHFLAEVRAPTLLIVGGEDREVLRLNESAAQAMRCQREVVVIPGATHLFEEPGTLEAAAEKAGAWFLRYLCPQATT